MDNGVVCQSVQVSAFPDRYSNFEPVASDILSGLGGGTPGGGDELANLKYIKKLGNQLVVVDASGKQRLAYPVGATMWWLGASGSGPGPGTGSFAWPFDPSTVSDEYGPRTGGVGTFHEGIDFGVGCETPIPSIANGTGSENYYHANFGNMLIIDHGVMDHGTYNGKQVRSLYAHQSVPSPIAVGASVTKGQIIGSVGDTGASFGCHLHMEVHITDPGGSIVWNTNDDGGYRTAVNPRTFLDEYSV
jgi:murein DD-endopeptidase MepM/ murein hydrolase activator NlpD